MTRKVLANVGFEFELAGFPHNKAIRKQEARFAAILRLVDGWEDADLLDETTDDEHVLVWGAGPRARAAAPNAAAAWPALDVVRRVNDKRFAHHLAVELGLALPGACEVAAAADVFSGQDASVVLKHPFGVAGRGLVHVRKDDSATRAEVSKMLAETSVVMEPRVEIIEEWSGQFDCSDDGTRCVGFTGLMALPNGQFRGNTTVASVPTAVQDQMAKVAALVQAEGYRGPVGIDGYHGVLAGKPVIVPLSEINARWTFGRLALELRRWLGRDLRWHHPPRSESAPTLVPAEPGAGAGLWALPQHCDPDRRSATYIEGI